MRVKLTAQIVHDKKKFLCGEVIEFEDAVAKRLLALAVAVEVDKSETVTTTAVSESPKQDVDNAKQEISGGGIYTPLTAKELDKMSKDEIISELAVIGVSVKGNESKPQLVSLYIDSTKV
jgi:hypothetical protein